MFVSLKIKGINPKKGERTELKSMPGIKEELRKQWRLPPPLTNPLKHKGLESGHLFDKRSLINHLGLSAPELAKI